MAPLVPALLLALFGGGCGTFAGGASFAGAAVSHLALAAMVFALPPAGRLDPLRLGRAGRLLPAALGVALVASWWASPVARAGSVGLVLIPLFFALPAAVARCWRDEPARRIGPRAVAVVVGGVALASLLAWLAGRTPRPAEPLGQHTLLAAWLAILLPLGVVPAREAGPWRWVGRTSGALALAAIVASRSLLGVGAVAVEALLLLSPSRGRRRALAGAAALLAVAVVALPRTAALLGGEDRSARARAVYLEAGIEGFRARPLLGWGPGSVPWTAAGFLAPVPGLNPQGEAVGDLHSLPVQLLYELGAAGALLALAVALVFLLRRAGEERLQSDPVRRAGLLGLAGAAVLALGNAAVAVAALPLAAAVAAGATLPVPSEPMARGRSLAVRLYAILSLALLAPLDLAERHYERAAGGSLVRTQAELARAVRLDPGFPLYRARLASYRAAADRRGAAEQALRAAEDAHAVAPLWLLAGALGAEAGRPWAAGALERACATSPLDSLAPFYRVRTAASPELAAAYGGRALAAEPRLAAALWWEGREELFARAAAAAVARPGIDPGWRQALAAALPRPEERAGPVARLAFGEETEGALVSPFTFRRAPWRAFLLAVPVRERLLARLALPSAATLPATSREVFAGPGCRWPGVPPPPAP